VTPADRELLVASGVVGSMNGVSSAATANRGPHGRTHHRHRMGGARRDPNRGCRGRGPDQERRNSRPRSGPAVSRLITDERTADAGGTVESPAHSRGCTPSRQPSGQASERRRDPGSIEPSQPAFRSYVRSMQHLDAAPELPMLSLLSDSRRIPRRPDRKIGRAGRASVEPRPR